VYELRFLDAATRDLEKLDTQITRRILARLRWLAANFDDIRPETLTGDLSGLFKFRVGDYRVIYEVMHDEQIIMIHMIGHRRDVYRRR